MSEMVEKVARAIHQTAEPWDSFETDKAEWIKQARAAIEAMHEPTEAMVNRAAMDEIFAPRLCWVDMIDEALK